LESRSSSAQPIAQRVDIATPREGAAADGPSPYRAPAPHTPVEVSMVPHNRLHTSDLRRRVPIVSTAVVAAAVLLVAGCSSGKSKTPAGGSSSSGGAASTSGGAASGSPTGSPITIGISLSLTGDFSDPGTAA